MNDVGDELVALAPGKLVYEFHWYKWFARGNDSDDAKDKEAWAIVCGRGGAWEVAFASEREGAVFFVGVWGEARGDMNYGDGRFLECVIEYLKEEQEAWALWVLQGSYYLCNGVQDFEETFGVLDAEWHSI